MPIAETELHYTDPFGLLVAVILSAQCTDKRVNMVTPALLNDFPTPEAMAATNAEVIFEYIKSVTFPNNKSKHLVGMAQKLTQDFDGVVPDKIEELQKKDCKKLILIVLFVTDYLSLIALYRLTISPSFLELMNTVWSAVFIISTGETSLKMYRLHLP